MAGATNVQDEDELWRQGSLLSARVTPPSLYWAHPAAPASRPARSAVKVAEQRAARGSVAELLTAQRAVKPGERAVVVSQTCDVLKSAVAMPQVELARAFETDNAEVVLEAENRGSSRYFRLDDGGSDPAVILDYTWRTFIDKGLLEVHGPDNRHLKTSWRRQELAHWLGRRYARPVLSDRDVATISDPIRTRWRQLVEEDPEAAALYSAEFAEFRFRRGTDGGLVLYVLSPKREPDPVVALEVVSVLTEALAPHHPDVTVADAFSYHTFTKADELDTAQIDLDWASHEEVVVAGELAVG